jgi:hypothetical protein
MKVIFYKARYGNFVDKTFAFKTSSWKDRFNGKWLDSYSHCEVLFDDGMMYSASQWDNAVRSKEHHYNLALWTYVDVDWNELTARYKADALLGVGYDYRAIANFLLPIIGEDGSRMFCSEYCNEVGYYCNDLKLQKDSYKESPNSLYKRLTNG